LAHQQNEGHRFGKRRPSFQKRKTFVLKRKDIVSHVKFKQKRKKKRKSFGVAQKMLTFATAKGRKSLCGRID